MNIMIVRQFICSQVPNELVTLVLDQVLWMFVTYWPHLNGLPAIGFVSWPHLAVNSLDCGKCVA